MFRWLFISFLFIGFFSCSSADSDKQDTAGDMVIEKKKSQKITILKTNIDYLRLRETKGKGGNVIGMLPLNTELVATGRTSAERTEETLRGIRFNEPWVEVKTKEGKIGWIYGGALSFVAGKEGKVGLKLLRRRLDYFFGKELGEKIYTFKDSFYKKQTSDEFADLYSRSSEIVAEANKVLKGKALVVEESQLPDLSWVTDRLPGHIIHDVFLEESFQIFRDYRVFAEKSKKTLGKIDDSFFNLCLTIYGVDSIEYIVPVWQMYLPKTGIVSLLGKGVHFDILRRMNVIVTNSELFNKEIAGYKSQLMEDLLNQNAIYWYSKDKILEELDSLIDSGFGILTKNDLIALKTRRDIIANAQKESIIMNMRAGKQ